MMYFAHKSDCSIKKSPSGRHKDLFNGEGEFIASFDVSWTDDQIWRALDLANAAYTLGRKVGRAGKAAEIRQALEED